MGCKARCGRSWLSGIREWRAGAYVLRQQGHDLAAGGAACAAWSLDGRLLASGGDDARVKLWLANS